MTSKYTKEILELIDKHKWSISLRDEDRKKVLNAFKTELTDNNDNIIVLQKYVEEYRLYKQALCDIFYIHMLKKYNSQHIPEDVLYCLVNDYNYKITTKIE